MRLVDTTSHQESDRKMMEIWTESIGHFTKQGDKPINECRELDNIDGKKTNRKRELCNSVRMFLLAECPARRDRSRCRNNAPSGETHRIFGLTILQHLSVAVAG